MHEKVMIIDDSAVTRKILEVMLRRKDIPCISFPDGLQALSALQRQPDLVPLLIILDVVLPGLDGYKVAQMMKSSPRLSKTVIIMLSGRHGVLDRLKGRLAGASMYLTKPLKTKDILAVVFRYVAPQESDDHIHTPGRLA